MNLARHSAMVLDGDADLRRSQQKITSKRRTAIVGLLCPVLGFVAYCLFFPRPAFVDLIKRNPALALNMMAVLARRLRRFTGMIENLSLKEVPGRLAAHFLYLSDRKEGARELKLDISKNQLASLLGTIPETLSRILARMGKEGLIETIGTTPNPDPGPRRPGRTGRGRKKVVLNPAASVSPDPVFDASGPFIRS